MCERNVIITQSTSECFECISSHRNRHHGIPKCPSVRAASTFSSSPSSSAQLGRFNYNTHTLQPAACSPPRIPPPPSGFELDYTRWPNVVVIQPCLGLEISLHTDRSRVLAFARHRRKQTRKEPSPAQSSGTANGERRTANGNGSTSNKRSTHIKLIQ